ncbi:hypothetical protein OAC12_02030 [Porticoccaceae bacterium]|nr:hypothetical protein [Porticoccaceae bacterium]
MDVTSRSIAIFSIALNIFFVANYFSTEPGMFELNRADAKTVGTFESDAKDNNFVVLDSDDLNAIYLSLIKQGLSEDQTKYFLFAKLKQRYIDTIAKPNDKFWIHQPLAQIEYMEALSKGYQQVRKGLYAIYGDCIKEDSIVRDLFYPVANQYPFLNSRQQIAVQQMQLDMHKSAMSMHSQDAGLDGIPVGRSPEEMLKAVLDEETLKVYQLRTSPMADKMRRTEIQFTEQDFRYAFDILDQLQSSQASGVSALEDLKELLGDQHGLVLWSALDPVFLVLKRISLQHSISNDKTLAAYDLVITAKKEIGEAALHLLSQVLLLGLQELPVSFDTYIIGTWRGSSDNRDFALLSVFEDGQYIHAVTGNLGLNESQGMEWGTVSLSSQGFGATTQEFDTNGAAGLSAPNTSSKPRWFFQEDGPSGTSSGDGPFEGGVVFSRMPSEGLLGTWLSSTTNAELLSLGLFDDNTYFYAIVDRSDPTLMSGMELGTYSRDDSTGLLTITQTFDNNGSAGFTDFVGLGAPNLFAHVSGDTLTLTMDNDGDSLIDETIEFTRQKPQISGCAFLRSILSILIACNDTQFNCTQFLQVPAGVHR